MPVGNHERLRKVERPRSGALEVIDHVLVDDDVSARMGPLAAADIYD
jgi:hypothetical protein